MGGRRPDASVRSSAHGKRLACFRPRQRFCAEGSDAFEHVHVEDAIATVTIDEEADAAHENTEEEEETTVARSKFRTARGTTLSKRKMKLQAKFALEQRLLQQQQVVCDCEYRVFRCQLIHPDDSWAALEDNYMQRVKKWHEKFDAHDWKQERICQKWKENQKKFTLEAEEQAAERSPRQQQRADGGNDRSSAESNEAQGAGEDPSKLSPSKSGYGVKQAFSNFATAAEGMLLSRQFDSLLRAGVPPHLRGRVWWMCSGAVEKQRAATESYPELLKRLHTLSKCASMEIEKDLPRTFPTGDAPRRSSATENSADDGFRHTSMGELRRILQAYSLRNPDIGYCQSMNFLAAILLHHMEEEEAFWVLVAMVEELTPHYHARSMAGSRADQRVFSDLVQQKLPSLYQHMQHLGVDFEPFTLKWFLCSFLNTLPFEPVLRIWDLLFCEGSHVLLRVGLTLLKLMQPRILACDDAIEVYGMFKISHETLLEITTPYRSGLLNRDDCICDTLIRLTMDKSFVGPIPFDSLHELRQYYRNDIEAEYAEMEARRPPKRSSATSTAADADGNASSPTKLSRASSSDVTSTDDAELLDYDFIDEYTVQGLETSPSKYIHFRDLYDSEDGGSDYFVDVNYDCASRPQCH
uniref:Rab-GAP TBC domain-containing protein n=1 Tax=Globisporangium ultimum (strain ATCC 200006 / CBS 805.95 / DAOM BR144) TaxID=431595 RepID=K3WIP8_GLOUD